MDSHAHSAQVGRLEVVDTGRRHPWSGAHARRSITRERDQSGRLEANRENRIGGLTARSRPHASASRLEYLINSDRPSAGEPFSPVRCIAAPRCRCTLARVLLIQRTERMQYDNFGSRSPEVFGPQYRHKRGLGHEQAINAET